MPTTQNINFARSSIVDVQKWDSSLLVSEALPVGLNPGDVVAVDEVAQVVDVGRCDVGAGPGELHGRRPHQRRRLRSGHDQSLQAGRHHPR